VIEFPAVKTRASRRHARLFPPLGSLLLWLAVTAQAPPDTISPGGGDPVHVSGRLMTLAEIIERCTEGERTKLAGHRDMTYTATTRAVLLWKSKKQVHDSVNLVYEDESDTRHVVELAKKETHYHLHPDGAWANDDDDPDAEKDKDGEISVNVSEEETGGLAALPFFLQEQSEYEFALLERRLEKDHVIFKISFDPRSPFKPLPSGTVYVDTKEFRIIHEEFTFRTNPFPLLLKDIRRVSRHWKQLPTGEWVPERILAEIRLRGSWMKAIPEKVEVSVLMSDYVFDAGYDETRLGPRK
jgi:hypothetical protein